MDADPIEWRKSQQHGREKGCWVYIPANALALSLTKGSPKKPSESRPGPIAEGLLYRILPWGKNRVIVAFESKEK